MSQIRASGCQHGAQSDVTYRYFAQDLADNMDSCIMDTDVFGFRSEWRHYSGDMIVSMKWLAFF